MISASFSDAREVHEEMQAAAQQRLREIAGAVRGQHHAGRWRARERAELGDRDLEVAQHLEQERLELRIGLVDLVDQEHHPARRGDRAQQRPLEQVVEREDVVRDVFPVPALAAIGLDPEQLLLVVPLEQRARLVEALVALQAQQVGPEHAGEHLAELGLARSGRALGEQRLLQRERQEERRLDARRGDVARVAQSLPHLLEGERHRAIRSAHPFSRGMRSASVRRCGRPTDRTQSTYAPNSVTSVSTSMPCAAGR